MALPATDNFNRDGPTLGANWTGSVGSDLAISASTIVIGTASDDSSMYWNADAPDAGQYAQAKLAGIGGGKYRGPAVRTSATDWVSLIAESTTVFYIQWYNGGSWTAVGSNYSATPAVNDVLKITADADNFKGYINGTERISGTPAGTAPSTGYGGLYIYGNSTNGALDDFEVGNLAAPSGVGIPLVMKDQRMRRVA